MSGYLQWMASEEKVRRLTLLGESLADEFAAVLVRGELVRVGDGYLDSRMVPYEVAGIVWTNEERVRLIEAIQWLDSRGLLERHRDEPAWVKVIEPAATG